MSEKFQEHSSCSAFIKKLFLKEDEFKSFLCDIVYYKTLSQNEMSKSLKKNRD